MKLNQGSTVTLGTGHYLSPGGSEDFGGDHLIFRRTGGRDQS